MDVHYIGDKVILGEVMLPCYPEGTPTSPNPFMESPLLAGKIAPTEALMTRAAALARDVNRARVIAVAGPTGSAKTTTIRWLARVSKHPLVAMNHGALRDFDRVVRQAEEGGHWATFRKMPVFFDPEEPEQHLIEFLHDSSNYLNDLMRRSEKSNASFRLFLELTIQGPDEQASFEIIDRLLVPGCSSVRFRKTEQLL